tara:strand:- start:12597 stop:14033 length:1437 start_codon:yes stop_codon:yes gene_type:complete
MQVPKTLFSRVLKGTTIGAATLASAFILLGSLGYIGAAAALATWGILTAIFGFGIWMFMSDFVAVLQQVSRRKNTENSHPFKKLRTSLGKELNLAIQNSNNAAKGRIRRREGDFEELEIALDALPGPLLQLNIERGIVRANEAAKSLFGENLENRDLATVMRNPNLLDALDFAIQNHTGRDIQFTLPTPVERLFFARVVPLERPARDGTALMIALVDLTSIQRADQMRVDFIANASHEIRTPLATLIGFIETLRGPARDDADARDKFLEIMESHAQRMSSLVDDLLSLSRIEMDEHTPPKERANLPIILESVRDQLKWHAHKRNVSLNLDLSSSSHDVLGNKEELIQLFYNLVSNAIKYGNPDSVVSIKTSFQSKIPPTFGWQSSESGAIAIIIKDNGDGIAREHIPRLTERFYRINTARSRELGGTGLGLAIVKHIINKHRGALTIESEEGVGSTFTVFLKPAPEKNISVIKNIIES